MDYCTEPESTSNGPVYCHFDGLWFEMNTISRRNVDGSFKSFHSVTYLKALDLRSALLGSSSQYLRSSKILSMTGFSVSERYGIPTT